MTCAVAVAVVTSACSSGGRVSAQDVARVVARVSGEACSRTVEGSAFLVGESLYVTNAHVIAGTESGLRLRAPGAPDVQATVVAFDPERDLALLSVRILTGPPPSFALANAGEPGVIAAVTTDLEIELIEYEVLRRITATGDDIYGEGDVERQAVEVAADVSSGVSGAGLVNDEGELVGVVFAESKARLSTYAVAASEIEALIAESDLTTAVPAGRCD